MLSYADKLRNLARMLDDNFAMNLKFVVIELTKLLGALVKHEFITRFEL